ncbi:uncharacterized protein EAE97_011145 [Botrytis byssoidea]|uniref:Uncharacterized protein n=1 Tax=Botrytis byssoidea TaxID=139641 RepID=A0A9P5I1G8_9HELO|nr:uncharacterized protein EAE97_011145 [Botrytis byssoidea]KAF7922403.1 hypothetical protein EAE97_011145 [Botrytis byssoidea]
MHASIRMIRPSASERDQQKNSLLHFSLAKSGYSYVWQCLATSIWMDGWMSGYVEKAKASLDN